MRTASTQRAHDWLATSNLRPTRQRVLLAEALVGDGQHRHVTAENLFERAQDSGEKVSLATVYNTLRAFCDAGLLHEITVDGTKSYFDTNTSVHHHFFDEDTNELIDCNQENIDSINIKNNITGKKINSVEVLIKVASDYQNQK